MVLAGLWRAQARVVEGVLEAHGPMLAWLLAHLTRLPGGAAALTFGHVVIARDRRSLEETRAFAMKALERRLKVIGLAAAA